MPMKSKRKIRAVIFDLGGVVVHAGYLDFIKHFCLKCLTSAGRRKIGELERLANLGKMSEQEFYRRIRKVFDVKLSERQMHDLIVKEMRADKDLVKFIPKLKPAKLALFTNSIGHMAAEVIMSRRIPVKKLFDRVFLSNVLHLAKPDQKAYWYILRKLKVRPAEALLVDDRPGNIRAARLLGMAGIVYKNFGEFRRILKKYEFA